jgi:hypothetical protein
MGTFGRFFSHLDEKFNFKYTWFQLFEEERVLKAYLEQPAAANKEIFFSIITPVYGIDLEYVKEFSRSLLKQTYKRWELCLCIDGHQPEVEKHFKSLQSRYPGKFKIAIKQNNSGIDAATFAAGKMADGDFICFVDADDTLHARCLEVLKHAINRNPDADFIFTDNDYMTPWGHRNVPVVKPGWNIDLLRINNYINHLTVVSKGLYRACENLFEANNKGVQDWMFNLIATEKAKCIMRVPFILYHWRARKGSLATGGDAKPHVVGATLEFMQNRAETEFLKGVVFDVSCWNYRGSSDSHCVSVPVHTTRTGNNFGISILPSDSIADSVRKIKEFADECICDHYFFHVKGQNPISGNIEHLLAFSSVLSGGVVWPHKSALVPTNVVYDQNQGNYFAVGAHHSFNYESHSVDYGPLHSAVIKREVLYKIIDSILSNSKWNQIAAGPNLEVLGIGLSKTAKLLKLTNISIKGAYCDEQLSPVAKPKEWEIMA